MTGLAVPTVDVRRAADRFATKIDWLDSKHSFSFGHHYDRANTHFGLLLVNNDDVVDAGTGLRDAPAPRHGDRHLGAARRAGPPGLAGPQRPDLPGPGPADERRHRHPALGEERQLARHRRPTPTTTPVHFVQMWVVPDEDGIAPGYEQLEIDDELLRGGLVPVASGMPEHKGAAAIRIAQKHAALHAARLAPGGTVTLPDAPFVHAFVPVGSVDLEGEGALGDRRRRAADRQRRSNRHRRPGRRRGARLGDARPPGVSERSASTRTCPTAGAPTP